MTAVAPTPDGSDLTVTIRCASVPAAADGPAHVIAVHADWSATTEHDLAAERLARSLGGWCDCLHLVETTLPAYRHALDVMSRPLAFFRRDGGAWMNTPHPACLGATHRHPSLRSAVRHELSHEHAVRSRVHQPEQTETAGWVHWLAVLWAAREAWVASAPSGIGDLDVDDYRWLWNRGVLPQHVARRAGEVLDAPITPPREFFVAAHFVELENVHVGRNWIR